MKLLSALISESLEAKYIKYFKQILATNNALIKDNKIQQIDVDINNIGCPDKPFLFNDFCNDKTIRSIIDNNLFGFTVINQMLKIPKKYLTDNNKELTPDCWPFSYQQGENMYFIGLAMFDKNVSHIDNFINLVAIETSLIVEKSSPVLKEMLKQVIKNISKEHQYSGITAKPTHPKMKAILLKLGFSTFKDNKDILTYKL